MRKLNYHVYILYSTKLERFYVGITNNLKRRFSQHNRGESNYTNPGLPWVLLWSIRKPTKHEAEQLERKLKNLRRSRKLRLILKYKEGIQSGAIDLLLKIY